MTDDFDDDLFRDAIRDRSGGPVHTAPGREAVLARAARSRTRRTVAIGGSTTLVLVAGLILLAGTSGSQLEPAQQPASSATPVDSTPDGETLRPATTETTRDTVATTSSTDDARPSTDDARPSTSTVSDGGAAAPVPGVPSTPPTTASTVSPTTSMPTTTSTTSVPTAPADAPFTRRYDSLGGSITVRWDGSALSLVSVEPAAGFVSEVEDQTTARIRVRFRSDDDDSRIDVRADDGRVTSNIS